MGRLLMEHLAVPANRRPAEAAGLLTHSRPAVMMEIACDRPPWIAAWTSLESPGEEAQLKAAGTYGGALYAEPSPVAASSPLSHQHFGPIV
jgi:hypothetical protein